MDYFFVVLVVLSALLGGGIDYSPGLRPGGIGAAAPGFLRFTGI
jgi:hypothetical protein